MTAELARALERLVEAVEKLAKTQTKHEWCVTCGRALVDGFVCPDRDCPLGLADEAA